MIAVSPSNTVAITVVWPELLTEATMGAALQAGIRDSLQENLYGVPEPAQRLRLVECEFFLGGYLDCISECDKQVDVSLVKRCVEFHVHIKNTVNAELLRFPTDERRIASLLPLQALLRKPIPSTSRTVLKNWLGKVQAACFYVEPRLTEQEVRWFYDDYVVNWTVIAFILQHTGLTDTQLKSPLPTRPLCDVDDRELWTQWAHSRVQLESNAFAIERAWMERTAQRQRAAALLKYQQEATERQAQQERLLEEYRQGEQNRLAYEAAKQQLLLTKSRHLTLIKPSGNNEAQ